MGYRDDLYSAEHLIGYTGAISRAPSVYFRKGDEFGHITQAHEIDWNIGRELAREAEGYRIDNRQDPREGARGDLTGVESWNGKARHVCRTLFTPAERLSAEDRALLLQAVIRFRELKERYGGPVIQGPANSPAPFPEIFDRGNGSDLQRWFTGGF